MTGIEYADVKEYLLDMEYEGIAAGSHRAWVEGNLPRFLRTLDMVPPGVPGQRCLEIGGMPYTFTLLMKKFRPYDLSLVDFYSTGDRQFEATVRLPRFGETHRLSSALCDVERDELPFAAESFDGALCCEVLEHLTRDPVAMLAQIHRVLKPGGWLVLTTPNVANLTNILALLHGRNVYRPYELVFGPTWRHNREYTAYEVQELLRQTGFAVDTAVVEDAHPPEHRVPRVQRVLRRILEAWYRQNYGYQLYARATRGAIFHRAYPAWLFEHADLASPPAPRLP